MSESPAVLDAAAEAVRDDIWEGLNRALPELSPKYFYDRRGSELFEQITELDEYYPTRTERGLLSRWAPAIMGRLRPKSFMELGAGSAQKTRTLLDAMVAELGSGRFVPLDVSGDFLAQTAAALRSEYPSLEVVPEVADFSEPFQLAHPLERPALLALLGGTIGNFSPAEAVGLLGRIRKRMEPSDAFLLGADLRPGAGKTVAELEAAYDDASGVTAEFNRNILRALNEQAGTDFPDDAFRHHAFYNQTDGRIEMHLLATRQVEVTIPERGTVRFEEGKGIRTEISSKYDRRTLEAMFERAGLRVTDWLTDARGRYALVLGVCA